ncbi:MAG TPA: hypothetical protein VJ946_13575, partial [Bacteroidales bacterium]|nr:hypothetical protein [Bacteroidales bacterium]
MRRIIVLFIFIVFAGAGFSQEKIIGEFQNSDEKVNPDKIDFELLSKVVYQEMNMFMDSLHLEGFEKSRFLEKIARDHAREMALEGRATTDGSGKTKDITSRIQYYGGSGIGNEIVMRYNIKTTDAYLTYRELARGIVLKWSASTRTMRELRKQKFFLAGVGSAMGERGKKVYVSFMMGNYFTKNAGAYRIEEIEPPVSTGGLFPFWRWGIEGYEYRACRKCTKYFPDIIDLQKGLSIKENGDIIFKFNDLRRFKRLIRGKKDGLAVDIVRKEQYTDCDKANIADYSLVNRGIMLKPVYSKKIYKKNQAPAEGKRERVKKLEVKLGEFPEELNPEDVELNLMILQDKKVCYNLPPSFAYDAGYEYSQKIGLLPDTIVPQGVPAYTPEATSNKLEFRVPFERNKSTYKMADIQPVISALNEPDFIINKVHVAAYSSLEGSVEANRKLQERRAQSIVNALRENQNESLIDSVTSAANWNDFKKDVMGTNWENMADMTMSEAIQHIRSERLAKKLEPILENHRYADVTVWITYDITGEKEENYVVDQFNKAIEAGDKAQALSIQKYMYEQVADGNYGKQSVEAMKIPEGEDYIGLNMNRICMEKIVYDDVIDSTYQAEIYQLWDMDEDNPYTYFNRLYCGVLLDDVTDEYVRENLQDEIDYLYDYELGKKQVDLLNIELQYKVMDIFHDSVGADHPVVEESLATIKDIISFDEVNWQNSLKLASIYLNHGDYHYAYELLNPFVDDEKVFPELLFTYISLCSKVDHKLHSHRFVMALARARDMDPDRFCTMFEG